MEIIKYRNNIRYFYKDSYLIIIGSNEKLKIKANDSEYEEIEKIFSEASLGISEKELENKFLKYISLISLLLSKDILYKINLDKLNIHLNNDYFPWIEETFNDVSSKLEILEKVKFIIPKNFYGCDYLINLYKRNDICAEIKDTEVFQIILNGEVISEYQVYRNSDNEIIISPPRDGEYKVVNEENISERIVSHFVFYSTILTALKPDEKIVFFISEFMEVSKKRLFEGIKKEQALQNKKISMDSIINLNALEKFVNLYDSKIISFNKNKEYSTYLQSPIQIITIQTSDLENHYFSDVSYERLAKFISETVFIEVIKKYYGKDFIVKLNDRLVHKTKFSIGKGLYLLSLDAIIDGDLIQSILCKENNNISIFIQSCNDESRFLLIRSEETQEIYRYRIPIQTIEEVTTILFTWISSKINLVNATEAWFEKVDIDLANSTDCLDHKNIFETASSQSYDGQTNNLDNILTECEFSYNVLEVE